MVKKTAQKKKNTPLDASKIFDEALQKNDSQYILRLYITGATPQSLQAITNIKKICEEYLKNRYSLEIIDIYQQPQLAEGDQIIAAPTLIKRLPTPLKKLIGDMSNTEKVLVGLDLKPKK